MEAAADIVSQMKLWPWQWRGAKTTGIGSAVARAEQHEAEPGLEKNRDAEHVSASEGRGAGRS